MKVAIIEKNCETHNRLKNVLYRTYKSKRGSDPKWVIDFYIDPEKFLNKDPNEYDVILVDCDSGSEKICFDFIHRIYDTTDAELCIMTNNNDPLVLESLLKDEHINSILDKGDLDQIVNHLSFSSARHRIKDHLLKESAVYTEIVSRMF